MKKKPVKAPKVKKPAIKKPAVKKPVKAKKPMPKKELKKEMEPPTKEEVLAFYGQFGKVNGVGETLLDENLEFSSTGKPGFHVNFESLFNNVPIPNEFKGSPVKTQVAGKIKALKKDFDFPQVEFNEDEEQFDEWEDDIDQVWGNREAPVATRAFAKRVTNLAKNIKERLQPGKVR